MNAKTSGTVSCKLPAIMVAIRYPGVMVSQRLVKFSACAWLIANCEKADGRVDEQVVRILHIRGLHALILVVHEELLKKLCRNEPQGEQ